MLLHILDKFELWWRYGQVNRITKNDECYDGNRYRMHIGWARVSEPGILAVLAGITQMNPEGRL